MTYYLVAWVALTCPGGWLGEKALPQALKPLICANSPRVAFIPNRQEAIKAVRDAGSSATLARCERLRCRPAAIEWQTRLVVDGEEVK